MGLIAGGGSHAPVPFREAVMSPDAEAVDLASWFFPGYSCGTAPDLHRLRLYALASGPEGTSGMNLLCERNGK